jgi:hypothetical protein
MANWPLKLLAAVLVAEAALFTWFFFLAPPPTPGTAAPLTPADYSGRPSSSPPEFLNSAAGREAVRDSLMVSSSTLDAAAVQSGLDAAPRAGLGIDERRQVLQSLE